MASGNVKDTIKALDDIIDTHNEMLRNPEMKSIAKSIKNNIKFIEKIKKFAIKKNLSPDKIEKMIGGKLTGENKMNEIKGMSMSQMKNLNVGDTVTYLGKPKQGFQTNKKYKVHKVTSSSTFEPTVTLIDGKKKMVIKHPQNLGENKMATKKKQKLNEMFGMIGLSGLAPTSGKKLSLSMRGNKPDNFEFKGLPGQFDKDGNKVLDEHGQPIAVKETILKSIKEYINSKENKKAAANELIKAIKSSI